MKTSIKKSVRKSLESIKKFVKDTESKLAKQSKASKIARNILMWVLIFLVSLITVDYAVQYMNYRASAAIVNGQRISKSELNDRLYQSYGTTITEQLIEESLILQKASEKGVTVNEEDLDAKISEYEEMYGGKEAFEQELANSNFTLDQLKDQISMLLYVQKILKDEITVTDEDKQEFFDQYKSALYPDEENPSYDDHKDDIEAQYIEKKVSERIQPWLDEEKADASIINNVETTKGFSFLGITKSFIENLVDQSNNEEK